jgi:GAF domain-containing protein
MVTQAVSHEIASEADAQQDAIGEGPSLSAMAERQTCQIDSAGEDRRWPSFGRRLAELGLCSCMAVPLVVDGLVGSLNLYAREASAFGVEHQKIAGLFATQAAFAVANAQDFASRAELAAQLQQAIESRPVIDRAIGVLMEREHVTAEDALQLLRAASQDHNKKLRDVARALLESIELGE